jgi:phage terminase Nu1 subunit (DNA packaging protein)
LSERYVTAAELAELLGVSERTVHRMRAEGMPSETWGLGRTRRYLPSACVAWARARRPRIEPVISSPVQSALEHLPLKG